MPLCRFADNRTNDYLYIAILTAAVRRDCTAIWEIVPVSRCVFLLELI